MEGAAVISYSFSNGHHEKFAHCIMQTIKAHLIYFSSGSNDFNLNPKFSGKKFLIVIVLCVCRINNQTITSAVELISFEV